MINKFISKEHQEMITLFDNFKDVHLKQKTLAFMLHISERAVRRRISEINRDRSHKIMILSDSNGFYVPNEITEKDIEKQAQMLKKQALTMLYRASSMKKKFGLPDNDIWDLERDE